MESEGRLLHKDWSLYDTGHVVFQPKHMTPEELGGRLRVVLRAAVFARVDLAPPPRDPGRRVPPCLAMSFLYKRSNRLLVRADCRDSESRKLRR